MNCDCEGAKYMSHKPQILIVEDEVEFAKMVKLRLEFAGFRVIIADDTETGTQTMLNEDVDLLILDLMMPGGGGFALLDAIKGDPEKSKVPVIILTGKTIDDDVKSKSEQFNVASVVIKPYDSKQFVEKIKMLLQK